MNESGGDPFKRFELEGWERSAEAYSRSLSQLTDRAAEILAAGLGFGGGSSALDAACGPGFLTHLLAGKNFRAIGADFSPAMIALAAARYPEIEFQRGDAEKLPFEPDLFSVVTMNFGLPHLGDPGAAFREAHRVLKPGGAYLLTAWAAPERALGFQIVLQAIAGSGDPNVKLPEGPPFFAFSSGNVGCAALRESGFQHAESRELMLEWNLQSAEELFESFLHGTARTGGLLRAQPPENLRRIREEVIGNAAKAFAAGGDGICVPMPFVLYTARR